MTEKDIKQFEEQRKKLYRYYYWQLFWGAIFVIIVFLGSIALGSRTDKFWLYIVIPLLVTGSFWIYIRTTYKQVEDKLNQLILKSIINNDYPDLDFTSKFELDRKIFREADFVENFLTLDTKNAIKGKKNDREYLICFLQTDADKDETTAIVFSGIFGAVFSHSPIEEFAILPDNEESKKMAKKAGLSPEETIKKMTVYGKPDKRVTDKVNELISELGINDQFYMTSKNGNIYFGIFDYKDFINLKLKNTINKETIEKEKAKVDAIIRFAEHLTSI